MRSGELHYSYAFISYSVSLETKLHPKFKFEGHNHIFYTSITIPLGEEQGWGVGNNGKSFSSISCNIPLERKFCRHFQN